MVRSVFIPINDKVWFDFYLDQAKQTGHGINGFQGMAFQRGNGLGSFLGRLFRSIFPVAKQIGKKVGRSIGKEALGMGANVIGDLAKGRNIKASLKEHGLNATSNLINKAGNSFKNQSGGRIGKRKVVSKAVPVKKRKIVKRDIFNNV